MHEQASIMLPSASKPPSAIKVTGQKVPLLLHLYDKGEFFVVAHQRYATRKRGRQLAPYITLHHFSGQLVASFGAELEHIRGGPLRSAIQCSLSSLIEEETSTRYEVISSDLAFEGDQLKYDIMELYAGYLEDHFNIHKLSIGSAASPPEYMTSASAQFAPPIRMGMYERPAPIVMWSNEPFKVDSGASTIMEADNKFDRLEDVPQVVLEPERSTDQETSKPPEKVMRRLAQNREAARKSRLRKKAYIQQLETSRIKLAQLEQDLQRARQQGVYANGNMGDSTLGFSGSVDPGVAAFELEYDRWVDEQNRHTAELRNALQGQTSELEMRMLVETGLNNYEHLFLIKKMAAQSDVFYIMSGMWKTPVERFFLWIGGFRPSEVLKILRPHLEPLTEQQLISVCGLQQTSTQAEDALFQGMEKLQQNVTETLTVVDPFFSSMLQMDNAVDRLKELVVFVTEADHLRQATLQQMRKILTTRQAAKGLLALGDYFQRLRTLSQLWATRPRESAIS